MNLNKMRILTLLALLLAVLCIVGAAAAEDDPFSREDPVAEVFTNQAAPPCDDFEASSYTTISDATAEAMIVAMYPQVKQAALTIYLSKYKIPYTQAGANDAWAVWDLLTTVYRDIEYYARPFYPDVYPDQNNRNYIGYFQIETYKVWANRSDADQSSKPISVSQILETNAAIDKKVDEIVSGVSAEMSDLEKVLYVHDWLCLNAEYDTVRLNNGTIPRTSYDVRGMFLYGIGVCQSYTWCFDYVMDRFGIPCINVTSDPMNHTWNQVKVGGYWYNMDITWDDSMDGKLGIARHYYFLCSDSAFNATRGHYSYYDGVSCTSTKYDNAFWSDVDTPMPYINGETFYLKQTEGIIKAINIDTLSSVRTVRSVSDTWYWHYTRNGYKAPYFTILMKYGDRLYFNDADNIMSVKADGSGYTVAKSFSTSDDKSIYGIRLSGDKIEYAYVEECGSNLAVSGSISLFVPITSIKLPFANAKFRYGYYAMVEATVNDGADPSRIIWSSSNTSVATVEAGGKVNGKKYGTTVITATSPDNSSVKVTMNLTIYEPTASISLAGNPTTVVIGSKVTLKAKLNTGALDNDIVWSSSNGNVLAVDSNGTVTAKALGTATITAKSYENSSVYATLTITVSEARPGDPNGDGEVNAKDAVLISQYVAGWAVGCDMSIADVNHDGAVNATDAVIVAQYIAGWNVTLG